MEEMQQEQETEITEEQAQALYKEYQELVGQKEVYHMKIETAKIISETLDEQLAKVAEQREQEKAKKEAYEQSIADLEKAQMHAECNELSVSSDLKRQLSLFSEFNKLVEEETIADEEFEKEFAEAQTFQAECSKQLADSPWLPEKREAQAELKRFQDEETSAKNAVAEIEKQIAERKKLLADHEQYPFRNFCIMLANYHQKSTQIVRHMGHEMRKQAKLDEELAKLQAEDQSTSLNDDDEGEGSEANNNNNVAVEETANASIASAGKNKGVVGKDTSLDVSKAHNKSVNSNRSSRAATPIPVDIAPTNNTEQAPPQVQQQHEEPMDVDEPAPVNQQEEAPIQPTDSAYANEVAAEENAEEPEEEELALALEIVEEEDSDDNEEPIRVQVFPKVVAEEDNTNADANKDQRNEEEMPANANQGDEEMPAQEAAKANEERVEKTGKDGGVENEKDATFDLFGDAANAGNERAALDGSFCFNGIEPAGNITPTADGAGFLEGLFGNFGGTGQSNPNNSFMADFNFGGNNSNMSNTGSFGGLFGGGFNFNSPVPGTGEQPTGSGATAKDKKQQDDGFNGFTFF